MKAEKADEAPGGSTGPGCSLLRFGLQGKMKLANATHLCWHLALFLCLVEPN